MIHYIYKIINNTNGKYYLGKHSTNNINDNYMGSGKLLKQAQKKYGISNFTKLILAYANTEDEVYELEERLITPQHVNDPMCYNLKGGGKGAKKGNTYAKGRAVSSATRVKISIANKGNTNKAKKIIQLTKNGNFIHEWPSASEASRQLGINQSCISRCANGERKSAGSFKWIKK